MSKANIKQQQKKKKRDVMKNEKLRQSREKRNKKESALWKEKQNLLKSLDQAKETRVLLDYLKAVLLSGMRIIHMYNEKAVLDFSTAASTEEAPNGEYPHPRSITETFPILADLSAVIPTDKTLSVSEYNALLTKATAGMKFIERAQGAMEDMTATIRGVKNIRNDGAIFPYIADKIMPATLASQDAIRDCQSVTIAFMNETLELAEVLAPYHEEAQAYVKVCRANMEYVAEQEPTHAFTTEEVLPTDVESESGSDVEVEPTGDIPNTDAVTVEA